MRMSQLFLPTLREVPHDAIITSHQLMLRAGMIRKISGGLYTYLPLGLRVFYNVANIIRQEMDAVGAQEFKASVVLPAELWKTSGRFDTFGSSMIHFTDQTNTEYVISPTAEELFSRIMANELSSYKQLPIIVYQINTKFRDEIRPRYGVMRAREFTMKDAYSFHADEKSLDDTYTAMSAAYHRIFERMRLNTIPVKADTGTMGGSDSEEFMVASEVGENTLVLCPVCNYAANVETATCAPDTRESHDTEMKNLEEIDTPNTKTIDALTAFFKCDAHRFIKTILYRTEKTVIAACIRGDLDINEIKLQNALGAHEIALADDMTIEKTTGAPVGFAGPIGLSNIPIIADPTATEIINAYTGANKKDTHFKNSNYTRDWQASTVTDIRLVTTGDACPMEGCSGTLHEKKGTELGHIFKLGYKYSKALNVTYSDEHGTDHHPIMGCYGIGVDRSIAMIIEQYHDENGIIWPLSVAPYHVGIIPVKYEGLLKDAADSIAVQLTDAGWEFLFDDRPLRPGVKFKDMDLIGIPLKIIIGRTYIENKTVEIKRRRDGKTVTAPCDSLIEALQSLSADA